MSATERPVPSEQRYSSTFSTESGSGSSTSERRHSRSHSPSRRAVPQLPSTAGLGVTPGRVYHNIWRNAQTSSATSLPSLRDLAETLIERGGGGASSSMAREVGSISSLSELADPSTAELRRPASYRELAIAKEVVVADRWASARWQLVLWFSCSCVMIILSWWWFGLGVLTGCIGLVGAVTGLRHDHNKHPILRPIKAAQLFGALSALSAVACLILFVYLWGSIVMLGAGRTEAPSTRYMIPGVSFCFAVYAAVSVQAAHTATGLIAQLAPTQYMPQSLIMPAENVETHLTNLDAGDAHDLQGV